jgi:glycosyl transferase family 25
MKRFVINLKRRADRLEQFFKRCPYTDVEVIQAFDGKNPQNENKKERKLISKFPQDRQPGAIGCSISHLRIWKKMINENIPMAMIFEDDCEFDPMFLSFMETLELPPNFKILYPGGRFEKQFVVPSTTMIPINNKVYQHNDALWNNRLHERTTHCYIITNELAKFLIHLFEIVDNPQPVDQFIIHSLKVLKIPVHSSYPLVCWSPIISDSDIR